MTATITITLRDDGKIQITGNIENPIVAFGLMELAKQELHAHHAKKAASAIITPPAGLKIERAN